MDYSDQQILMRDILKGVNGNRKPIKIRLDNNFIVREDTMCVKWDDDNKVLMFIYRTKGTAAQNLRPYTVGMCNYDQIQGMEAMYGEEEFIQNKSTFGLSDNELNNIRNFVNIEAREYLTGTLDSQNHTHSIPTGDLDV